MNAQNLHLERPSHSSGLLFGWFADSVLSKHGFAEHIYGTGPAAEWLVEESCKKFGISMWRLAHLLGCDDPRPVYRWARGEGVPSQFFLLRLFKLWSLHDEELPLSQMRSINWDTVTPVWKPSFDSEAFFENLEKRNKAMDEFMDNTIGSSNTKEQERKDAPDEDS